MTGIIEVETEAGEKRRFVAMKMIEGGAVGVGELGSGDLLIIVISAEGEAKKIQCTPKELEALRRLLGFVEGGKIFDTSSGVAAAQRARLATTLKKYEQNRG
ncbi:MAG: hypothetical protein AAB473_01325 [Patescibacteria group bacterium]